VEGDPKNMEDVAKSMSILLAGLSPIAAPKPPDGLCEGQRARGSPPAGVPMMEPPKYPTLSNRVRPSGAQLVESNQPALARGTPLGSSDDDAT
jgi:hypothetical protein